MKANEIYREIKAGNTLKELAETIGMNKTTLQRRLNKAGYTYDKETKEWSPPALEEVASAVEEVQEEKSPVEERKAFEDHAELVGYNEKDGQIVKVNKSDMIDLTETYNEKPEPANEQPSFTADEILALKDLLKKQGEGEVNMNTNSHDVKTELNEKVKALTGIERKRKTVILEETVSNKLDQFSAEEKIMKSDILHIALAEFFDKYSK